MEQVPCRGRIAAVATSRSHEPSREGVGFTADRRIRSDRPAARIVRGNVGVKLALRHFVNRAIERRSHQRAISAFQCVRHKTSQFLIFLKKPDRPIFLRKEIANTRAKGAKKKLAVTIL